MSEAPGDSPSTASTEGAAPAPPPEAGAEVAAPPARERREVSIRALLEAGAHFGHQTRRWDPKMKPFIFGERDGIHIIDLDKTLPMLVEALEFLREVVAQGGKVLFVGTKRQAQGPVKLEAERASQFYVNNRWLGGMLTNFRTVRKSIERFKEELAIAEDEERFSAMPKKELSKINRSITKYRKSLDGIKEMTRLPDALFLIDLKKEHIAVSEAQRLGIPIVAVVDSNCSPDGIDFPVPGNDDAARAIQLYCELAGDACLEGAELFNERVQSEPAERAAEAGGPPSTGRRVVEIRQPGGGGARGGGPRGGGPRGGGPRGAGRRSRQAGGTHSAGGRRREPEQPESAGEAPATGAPEAGAAPAAPPEASGAASAGAPDGETKSE
jgi:small subunit ribosomal protein S2